LKRSVSAFQLCGGGGFVCAVALALLLVSWQGLPLWIMTTLVLSSVLTFFALAMMTKMVSGTEQLTYHHHEIAVLGVAIIVLALLREPILSYLDGTILGAGAFLMCGRIGCLMAGCCHGRPCRWGLRYREEHADAGFTPYYVGVPLFPVQALESLW